jgi:hypothetical protein
MITDGDVNQLFLGDMEWYHGINELAIGSSLKGAVRLL